MHNLRLMNAQLCSEVQERQKKGFQKQLERTGGQPQEKDKSVSDSGDNNAKGRGNNSQVVEQQNCPRH